MISAMNAAENTALDCAQADNSLDNEAMMQVSEETISGPDQFEGAHHRVFDLRQILLSLVLLFSMCGAYCMAFVATIYGYVALSPTPLVIISHALHLGLYALKNCGFICEECYDVLNLRVKTMGLFRKKFFESSVTFSPRLRRS